MQGIDPQLDRMKQRYDGMDDLLTKVVRQVASDVPEWAQQYIENCIFFPQLGFLTVVPLDTESGKAKYEGEGLNNNVWERKFSSENMGYYKNNQMNEMDEYFGDMYGMICGN
jgi:DNA mismatch repair protein MSH5